MAAKATDVSMFKSFVGSMLFCISPQTNVISGIPPRLPPITVFPFKSSRVKLSIFSLDTRNEPSLFVRAANTIG